MDGTRNYYGNVIHIELLNVLKNSMIKVTKVLCHPYFHIIDPNNILPTRTGAAVVVAYSSPSSPLW